jgi:hypothetical protein
MTRYDRAPSPEFRALLAPGALLSPLLAGRSVAGLPLDVHLREGDHLHVYCGLTRLMDVSRQSKGSVAVVAHTTYRDQECGADLFRSNWSPGDAGFAEALDRYLTGVQVAAELVLKEGGVQTQWAAVREPWIPFDREAVVGYADTLAQTSGRKFSQCQDAWTEVEQIARTEGWAIRPTAKIGAELDQLAVDPVGRLVLVELKFGKAAADSVYCAPLQILQYAHEWATVFTALKGRLQSLIEARQSLGLSPTPMPALGDRLRPVIGFGAVLPSAEVLARLGKVREIANRHLPQLSDSIEVWSLTGAAPNRLI